MVKVDTEDGAAWKSLEQRCPQATAFIKVDHVNGEAFFLIQQNPQKHRCVNKCPAAPRGRGSKQGIWNVRMRQKSWELIRPL